MSQGFIFLLSVVILSVLIIFLIYRIIRKKAYKERAKEESTYPNSFKCIDGHVVRSKGELIIDNYLYLIGLNHVYEKKIKTAFGTIKPDWYLPEYNIFIEYWGFSGKRYEQRKKEKLNIYKKAKFRVISVENFMFSDIYTNLGRKLGKLICMKKNNLSFKMKKFCPSCGLVLDERFL